MALKRPAPPAVTSLACRGCGAPLQLRAPGHSVSVACGNCGALLDAQDPDFAIIATYESKRRVTPKIPLGTRGRLKGEAWEVVGFLVRRTTIADTVYLWSEYLLHNPTLGFRWLVESDGHWTLAKSVAGVPTTLVEFEAHYLGERYHHFQTAIAEITYVVGEFPWQARVGDTGTVQDYVNPPLVLSCERTKRETTWSIGEYVDGDTVWKAFGLTGSPPPRVGVGAAQPSPYAASARRVLHALVGFLAAALLVHLAFAITAQHRLVLDQSWGYKPGDAASHSVVSEPFTIGGRSSNVMVETSTNLANRWGYFAFTLVEEGTGVTRSFGRAVEYYFGSDGGESWSEGASWDRAYLPSVPAGGYVLIVEPESREAMSYRVRVTRDVPRWMFFWLAAGLLVIPPVVFWCSKWYFEIRRWQESDHPMVATTSGDEDE